MAQTPAADIVERLHRLAAKQREQRGDMMTYGYPDPEVDEAAAEIERLRAALEPFVSGAEHTMIFLRTREKMHSAGQDLYREDVERARAALKGQSDGE